jgi:deoxycytidylate deaminase
MTKSERAYFNAAKAVSELSDHRVKVGCVVVNKHRIIGSGFNSNTKCHKVQALLDKEIFGCECPGKLHAEVATLLPLIRDGVDLSKGSIFVYREHRDGTIACSRPCARCERLIKQSGIKKIYFTVENGFAEEKWQL